MISCEEKPSSPGTDINWMGKSMTFDQFVVTHDFDFRAALLQWRRFLPSSSNVGSPSEALAEEPLAGESKDEFYVRMFDERQHWQPELYEPPGHEGLHHLNERRRMAARNRRLAKLNQLN